MSCFAPLAIVRPTTAGGRRDWGIQLERHLFARMRSKRSVVVLSWRVLCAAVLAGAALTVATADPASAAAFCDAGANTPLLSYVGGNQYVGPGGTVSSSAAAFCSENVTVVDVDSTLWSGSTGLVYSPSGSMRERFVNQAGGVARSTTACPGGNWYHYGTGQGTWLNYADGIGSVARQTPVRQSYVARSDCLEIRNVGVPSP